MADESRGVVDPTHGRTLSERVIGLAIEVHRHLGPGYWSRLTRNACVLNCSEQRFDLGSRCCCL
jgi:hypothetical protein